MELWSEDVRGRIRTATCTALGAEGRVLLILPLLSSPTAAREGVGDARAADEGGTPDDDKGVGVVRALDGGRVAADGGRGMPDIMDANTSVDSRQSTVDQMEVAGWLVVGREKASRVETAQGTD